MLQITEPSPPPTACDADNTAFPYLSTVYDMVLRQAFERPSAVAVEARDYTLRYGDLPEVVERIAAGLVLRGVRRGDAVGVYCRAAPELPALVLAIWRCGAVYVPLDPKYPSQRLQAILSDVTPRVVVCDGPTSTAIDLSRESTCDVAALLDERKPANTLCVVEMPRPDAPAVVLYTSGSTGSPKGAVLSHRNLANHHAYVIRAYELGPDDRRTAVCSINFDASLEEYFCTLAAGATLVLPDSDTLDTLDRFLAFLERRRITSLFMPTSLWREVTNFLHAEGREFPAMLRLIDIGGERVTRPIYERFLQVGGRRIRWVNVYGPTECSIYATIYEHDPLRDAAATDAPPIGHAIDGVQLFILDGDGKLCPPGEPGELYLGGVGVGLGYWNKPELTAERFVCRPSPDLPQARYYRTGDQVRWRADGELEYVGRLDDQIKLRGFRIEPGEIEAVLQRHPSVRDAAVTLHTSRLGTPYLSAHIVLHARATWDKNALQSFAAANLPEYMVPRSFVQEAKLPLSPNGKVDRRSLRAPMNDDATPGVREAGRKPTELESRIADVWRALLGVPEIGLDDDYFSLGGDSLRAMSLAAKLEESLGVPVSAALLFTASTVARMAEVLELAAHGASNPLVLLREGDRARPLFLVHSLGCDAWIYRELIHHLGYPGAIFGLQLPGIDTTASAADDLETLAADYVHRIQTVQPKGPYRLAGYSSGGMLAYEMASRLSAAGECVDFLGLIDAGVPPVNERQLAGPTWLRAVKYLAQLPEIVGEIRRRGIGACGRRLWAIVTRRAASMLRRSAAADSDSSFSDEDSRACFAQDISFFKPDRLRQIHEHYQAVFRYAARSWCGEADLFRVRRQPFSAVPTRSLGWEQLIDGVIRVHDVAGSHSSLMQSPHAAVLAAALDTALAARAETVVEKSISVYSAICATS